LFFTEFIKWTFGHTKTKLFENKLFKQYCIKNPYGKSYKNQCPNVHFYFYIFLGIPIKIYFYIFLGIPVEIYFYIFLGIPVEIYFYIFWTFGQLNLKLSA